MKRTWYRVEADRRNGKGRLVGVYEVPGPGPALRLAAADLGREDLAPAGLTAAEVAGPTGEDAVVGPWCGPGPTRRSGCGRRAADDA